jgi:mannose/fructose/N-acetylgalactosamine-specific phosphotransferase system component IIC
VIPEDVILVVLLGGLLSLDAVSVAQTMVSRPIVASTLVGLLLGSVDGGLAVGALLELLALETMPFGASRYLEWSCGAVVAAFVVAAGGAVSGSSLFVGLIMGLASAWLAGASIVVMRRVNGRLVASHRAALASGSAGALTFLHASGITLDFVRGCVVAAVGVFAAAQFGAPLRLVVEESGLPAGPIAVGVAVASALAAAWRLFSASSRRRWLLLAGALGGAALLAGT